MSLSKYLVIMAILSSMFMLVNQFMTLDSQPQKKNYTEVLRMIESGQSTKVEMSQTEIYVNDSVYATYPINSLEQGYLIERIRANNIDLEYKEVKKSFLLHLFNILFPFFLIILIFLFMMKKSGGGGMMMPKVKNFKVINPSEMSVTFKDVAGMDEIRSEVEEVVDFIQNPRKYFNLGSTLPKGLLLSGPPGTGKTLIAKAMAKEAGCNFIAVSGSSFVEMFVGMGAKRVRELFAEARKTRPCIIFIDEIDAVGKKRGGGGASGGNDEREQTLNQILTEMDGFETESGIFVMAATNRSETLDDALVRPGRFDRLINVPLPTIKGRTEILGVHSKNKSLDSSVSLRDIARGTVGFSGADLANLINEASILSARDNKTTITQDYFEKAKDKIMMGPEQTDNMMNDDEKTMTAYHEAGHAIVGYLTEEHDPVHKVTIIPRGRALGVTLFLPERDKVSLSKIGILSQIQTLYAGRIAEDMIYGDKKVSTGASNDIERATLLARKMVTDWGMSSVGKIHIDEKVNQYGEKNSYSEKRLAAIDDEVSLILEKQYEIAESILQKNKDKLKEMTMLLIEKETIDSNDILLIMEKQNVEK
jgi:cell division protease FtsH